MEKIVRESRQCVVCVCVCVHVCACVCVSKRHGVPWRQALETRGCKKGEMYHQHIKNTLEYQYKSRTKIKWITTKKIKWITNGEVAHQAGESLLGKGECAEQGRVCVQRGMGRECAEQGRECVQTREGKRVCRTGERVCRGRKGRECAERVLTYQ
jgi:hypothetical protein